MKLTLIEADNGNCRVYYREGRLLRCFQEDQRGKFTLYVCSQDGEPECEYRPAQLSVNALPEDDSTTAKSFRTWFAETHEWQVWDGSDGCNIS